MHWGCQSRRMINEMCWPNLNINSLTTRHTHRRSLCIYSPFGAAARREQKSPLEMLLQPGEIISSWERANEQHPVCVRESVIHYHNTDMQASAHTEVMLNKVVLFYYFCSFISIKLRGNEFFHPHSSCVWIIPLFLYNIEAWPWVSMCVYFFAS